MFISFICAISLLLNEKGKDEERIIRTSSESIYVLAAQ